MHDDLLKKIVDSIGLLSLSETKVASCIIADPEIVKEHGMAAIASKAEVSDPTVMRFCRSMGFSSFSDFKETFISFLADGGVQDFTVVNPVDSIDDIISKNHLVVRQKLTSFVEDVEQEDLQKICDSFVSSSGIFILTDQALTPTAYSAKSQLLSCGYHSVVYSNSGTFVDIVKTLPPSSTLLFFSKTGKNDQMESAIKVAQKRKFTSIAVTKRYSALAAESDLVSYFPENQLEKPGDIDYLNFCGLLFVSIVHTTLWNMK